MPSRQSAIDKTPGNCTQDCFWGILTNDLEATIAFYEPLGFQIAFQTVDEAAGERAASLRLGGCLRKNHKGAARRAASLQLGDAAVEACENEQAARMGRRLMLRE